MFVLGFIEPWTWLVMVICGLIGLLYSGDSILDAIPFLMNKKKNDNKILKYLDVIMGIVAFVWLALLILDDNAQFRWLTVLLFVLFMVVSFAHPLKHLDGPVILLFSLPFIVIAVVAYLVKSSHPKAYTLFGATIDLWILLVILALIMIIFFLVVYFVTETIVNPLLYILGWAPLLFVICVLVIIQGILLLLFPVAGALHFLA